MDISVDKKVLDGVAAWAEARVRTGTEPPWTEQSLIDLARLSRSLARGMASSINLQDLPQSVEPAPLAGQSKANIVALNNARSRRACALKVQMPT